MKFILLLIINLILLASIKANGSTILCNSPDSCGQKFEDYLSKQRAIIAIDKEEYISLLDHTQPGYGLFLEGIDNEFKSGTIEYIHKNKSEDTEYQFIKKTLIKKLMNEMDKDKNYQYNWKLPPYSKKENHLRKNNEKLFSEKIKKIAKNIKGTFYIYTISNPCVYCMETYYKLINFFPKLKINVYYSLSAADDQKMKNEYDCQIKQFKRLDWFQNSILKKYSDEPNFDNYKKIIDKTPYSQSRLIFKRIFPHTKYKNLLSTISEAMNVKMSTAKKEDNINNKKNPNAIEKINMKVVELNEKIQELEEKVQFLEDSINNDSKQKEINIKNNENFPKSA